MVDRCPGSLYLIETDQHRNPSQATGLGLIPDTVRQAAVQAAPGWCPLSRHLVAPPRSQSGFYSRRWYGKLAQRSEAHLSSWFGGYTVAPLTRSRLQVIPLQPELAIAQAAP